MNGTYFLFSLHVPTIYPGDAATHTFRNPVQFFCMIIKIILSIYMVMWITSG